MVERIKGHSQNRCDKTQHYLHDEIEGEVFDHVGGIEGQGAAVEGVEHGVAGAVGRRGAAIRLAALAVVEGLPPEGALVDLSVLRTRERQAIITSSHHINR